MTLNEALINAGKLETKSVELAEKNRYKELQDVMNKIMDSSQMLDDLLETANTAKDTGFFKYVEKRYPRYSTYERNPIYADGIDHKLGLYERNGIYFLAVIGGGICGDNALVYSDRKLLFTDETMKYSIDPYSERNYDSCLKRATDFTNEIMEFTDKFYELINDYISYCKDRFVNVGGDLNEDFTD